MCGRYTLVGPDRITEVFPEFTFGEFSEYRLPRYNIAPTQEVLGVRGGGHVIEPLRWGFALPGGSSTINARAETLPVRPAFRDALVHRRCLVFADGFYEWKEKRPVYFTLRGGEPFAFAGLWEQNAEPSCVIVTCAPNELVRPVHDRMPVILPRDAIATWLSRDADAVEAALLLRPFDAASMEARAVSTRVNNANYDAPDVLRDDDPVQERLF